MNYKRNDVNKICISTIIQNMKIEAKHIVKLSHLHWEQFQLKLRNQIKKLVD